ncbi:MAG TPA: hypothetical protein VK859_02440, partial [bacterium]|nr:hypothetical protein [bacterium]
MRQFLFVFAVLTLGGLMIPACGSKNGPSSPSGNSNPGPTSTSTSIPCVNASNTPCTSTPTFTPTSTPALGIYWSEAYILHNSGAIVLLEVNGQPLTTVTAFVTGSNISSPVTLPYSSTESSGALYQATSGFTYQAGQTYSLTTVSGGLSASATLVAPGNITSAPNGSSVTWSTPGNSNYVILRDITNTITYYDSQNYNSN